MERIPDKANNQRTVILETQIFVRSRAVVSRVVARETLIVPVRGKVGDLASIYSFNETGSLIWKILEKPRAVADVVSEVAEAYEVDAERVQQDAMRFLSDMQTAGLIEVCGCEVSSVQDFLAAVPGAVEAPGTEGPVGREGLAAADAR
jgi:hypothetical protein